VEVTYSVHENPFNRLRTHTAMSSINAAVVPWLIAEFGIHYGDWDNVETAMPMITHVIVSQQLGGYTARTFPAAVDGHRVEQVAFTKFVLRTAGNSCVALSQNDVQPLTLAASEISESQHGPSQGYSEMAHQVAVHPSSTRRSRRDCGG
jgi:hypothetical protein